MNRYAMSVAVLAVTGSVCAQAVQWTQAEGGNGHWYERTYEASEITWHQARDIAQARGGDSVVFNTLDERVWINDQFVDGQPYCAPADWAQRYTFWVGLYQDLNAPDYSEPAGGWYWIDGTSLEDTPVCTDPYFCSFSNGGTGPEAFGVMGDGGIGWIQDEAVDADVYCVTSALIEWSADCNGDGIVDYGQILDGTYADDDGNGVPDCCDAGEPCDQSGEIQLLNVAQWTTQEGGNGHWYGLVDLGSPPGVSAEEHFLIAESFGGHTATMGSAIENQFCYERHGGVGALIGVRKVAGTNQGAWVTGEPWQYSNWHSGEGNNSWERYAMHWAQDGNPSSQWQDTDLSGNQHSIIEWDADCNGDGIVDYGQIIDGTFDDLDGNGVPDCCEDDEPCFPCPADIVGNDGVVNVDDLLFVIAAYGQTNVPADLDGDGVVDVHDILLILEYWGDCP